MKTKLLKISLASIALMLGLATGVYADTNSNICERPTDLISIGGVSIQDDGPTPKCPLGTNFPTFNVFNDAQMFPERRDPEFDFSLVRIEEDGYERTRQGYSNRVYLQEGKTAKIWNFVHNGGKPNQANTIARDVYIKINGFERDANGDYYRQPDRVVGGRAFHTITTTISSSNATPRRVSDTVIIETDANKLLKLIDDDGRYNGSYRVCTNEFTCTPTRETLFAPFRMVSGNGFELIAKPTGGEDAYYASELYRSSVSAFFEAVDVATCENLAYTQLNTPEREGDEVRFEITATPGQFQSDVRSSIGGSGRVNLTNNNRRLTATGWSNGDLISMFVQNSNVAACSKTVVLEAEPPTCETLRFERMNTPTEEGERVRYRLRAVTDGFRNDIQFNRYEANVDTSRFVIDNTVSFSDWSNGAKFIAQVPGHDACKYEDTLRVDVEPVCNSLTLTPLFDPADFEYVGQEAEFRVDVDSLDFFEDTKYTLDGSSENIQPEYRRAFVTGWSEGSTFRAVVEGFEGTACDKEYTFPTVDTETPICRSLTFDTDAITLTDDTAVIPTTVVVDEGYGDYTVVTQTNDSSGATFNQTNNTVVVTGVDNNTTVTAFVDGENASACRDTHTFFTEQECQLVTLEVTNETDDRISFRSTVNPTDLDIITTINEGNIVNLQEQIGSITFDVINFTEDTIVRVFAEGFEGKIECEKSYDRFEPKVNLCLDLSVSPDSYDHTESTTQRFRADITPPSLDVPYIWEIYQEDEDGDRELISREEDNETYTVRNLDGRQIIKVYIEDEFVEDGYECEYEINGEVPYNLCPDLQVRRTNGPGLYCPSNGQPIILETAGYGEFEDDVVWRAEGECNSLTGPIFTDGVQESRCELTTNIRNAVIVRGCNPNSLITVESVTQPDQCRALVPARDLPGDKPGEIFKEVVHTSFVSRDIDRVTYQITYQPNFAFFSNVFNTVTIFDNIAEILPGFNEEFEGLGVLPGTLSPIPGSMVVTTPPNKQLDISGSISSPDGVTISNLNKLTPGESISIQYEARLDSALKLTDVCERLVNSCGENFINTATDNFGQESSASLTALCPFILARGFGDVFLERDFAAGIDIAKCTSRPGAEGPVFTPAPEEVQNTPSTGGTNFGPSHRICQNGGVEGYGDEVLGSISSSVCEVGLKLSDRWQTETINNGIEVNILRIARNLLPLASSTISNLTEANLANLNPNPSSQVIIRDNADLTIGNPGETLTVDGQAKTIIVRNGNLKINSNIEYGPAQDPTKPPVIAFLVINGNIEIDPGVTDLVGIYAAVKKDEGTGFIQRSANTNELITIRGSVFGDLEPLFNQTTNVGNIAKDRGAVTVIYDGRIVLNTPPGLEDIVEFNQYQTANGSNIFN